jgi:hypothetical protein
MKTVQSYVKLFTFGGSHIRTQDTFNCRAPTGFTTWDSIIRVSLIIQGTEIYLLKYFVVFHEFLTNVI